MISIDELQKVELRAGTVTAAERVEGSEKLLKLSVDLGGEVRQIVSGIAKSYSPEDITGKQIVVVANLEPRKLMGLESNGMLLAAHDAEGNPVVLSPDREAQPGSVIR